MDADPPAPLVTLRQTVASDLAVLFAHQRDPEAARLAAFPSRTWQEFSAHWTTVLGDSSAITSTILVEGDVAGYVTSWTDAGTRKIGYWLGRAFWGKGVATIALARFTRQMTVRPLTAHVAISNTPSIRVLEKCGFVRVGVAVAPDEQSAADAVDELIFELA
jgi:RimJ/RimL family protein N-acetyltransferase